MPRPIHFELAVDDPERAAKFYADAFGWTAERWGGEQDYWLITTGQEGETGIDGAFARRSDQPVPWVNVIGVASVDDACAQVQAAGGTVTQPKAPIPGVGYAAYCTDTEGNPFGVYQNDPTATAEAS